MRYPAPREPRSVPPLPSTRESRRTTVGLWAAAFCATLSASSAVLAQTDPTDGAPLGSETFLSLLIGSETDRKSAVATIDERWRPGYAVRVLETLTFQRNRDIYTRLIGLLEKHTGKKYGTDTHRWYEWVWSEPYVQGPGYAQFKSDLYRNVDPIFAGYFGTDREATIRLDEVRWGGVKQDGIPPLRDPEMIAAADAVYLGERDVVFGIEINGDARAYPKRILAWHEMFTDTVGGIPVAGVYCTLCGTVILYETTHDGVEHRLGTSGFLFRSNKLMYDQATQSLWSTFRGEPVIGPLVGKGIVLRPRAVVTTRWGAWRKRHPDTQVLSLDTGHERDYSEGAAYREYFATDDLMFHVPKLDRRLKNKDEVLTMTAAGKDPLAISARFLAKKTLYHTELGGQPIVVVTDPSGANRVYETRGTEFAKWDGESTLVDKAGNEWRLDESALTSANGEGLQRLPAQRAFWFGWYAVYPETRLIK